MIELPIYEVYSVVKKTLKQSLAAIFDLRLQTFISTWQFENAYIRKLFFKGHLSICLFRCRVPPK